MCGLHGSFLWANFTWAGYLFRVFQGMPYMSRVSFWGWLKNLGWQLPFSGWNAIYSHKLCLYHHHNVTKTVIMIQYLLSLTWAGYVFCIIRSRPYISGSSFPDLGRTSRLLAYLVNLTVILRLSARPIFGSRVVASLESREERIWTTLKVFPFLRFRKVFWPGFSSRMLV